MPVSQLVDIQTPTNKLPSNELLVDKFAIYASSILAMMVLFFVGVFVPTSMNYNLVWGLAVGGMTSLWAGPGFGLMVASARVAVIEERQVHSHGHGA